MTVHTTTGHFNAPVKKVYDFLSKVENLPKWATSYCTGVRKENGDYIITTPQGEMIQIFECNEATGTIDMMCGPTKEELWCWPVRVISDNLDGTVVAFTCIQMPDQKEEEFAQECASLRSEFENIKQQLEAA